MTLLAWVELIQGILKFPSAVLALIKVLQKTPEEQHDALISKMQAEAQAFEDTGRPSWN